MDELKITKEKVLEAAAKCSTAKATLETLFPEAFEHEDEYLDIGDNVTFTTDSMCRRPFIGSELAPDGLEYRCIMARESEFDLVTGTKGSFHWVAFKKKK